MPPPLQAGQVTYDDGSPQTMEQYSKDVAAFLMWAAEPKLVQRKRIGFQVIIFLIVLTGLLYFTKKKVGRRCTERAVSAAEFVMPGLVPGIRVFKARKQSRGWPGQARP